MAMKKFCQAHVSDFRDNCVVFASNFKFANLIQYDMQYIPCNNALLVQETLHCCCPKEALCAEVLRAFAKLLSP